jgi:hypothetical protein
MAHRENSWELDGGEVSSWVIGEETALFLKAVKREGDPVELSAQEARKIATVLLKFADIVDG